MELLRPCASKSESENNRTHEELELQTVQCLCCKTWVLVVHNDFEKVDQYERGGNDVDVANLRRVFQLDRHCRFAELQNCGRERIIGTLANEEQLVQLFYPQIKGNAL
jgi:hypothetical protein